LLGETGSRLCIEMIVGVEHCRQIYQRVDHCVGFVYCLAVCVDMPHGPRRMNTANIPARRAGITLLSSRSPT
jgi:hypothetical protein